MLSGAMKEAQTGVIEIPDVCSSSMRVFLRFMYTGHVDAKDWGAGSSANVSFSSKPPLEVLFQVVKLGKKYLVDSVACTALEALKRRIGDENCSVDDFQAIFAAGIREHLGAIRVAAIEAAKKRSAIRTHYQNQKFCPEVQEELQGLWPVPQPSARRKRARFD
eukprot:gnl/TRDRNA2_/TRDRNA2_76973_c1_seq1.p1 gnl/TRDRNA2_/TRDRNA2_76973_c1~~gnl/TRDRNA2_/TRDRNA2_76973_c1_seq1.p1  ORF type:complete len:186 (+),score=34.99 gnl/TRDRNA2_/TRDRNA2_76973_c1_seq1:70-558(+)